MLVTLGVEGLTPWKLKSCHNNRVIVSINGISQLIYCLFLNVTMVHKINNFITLFAFFRLESGK